MLIGDTPLSPVVGGQGAPGLLSPLGRGLS